MATMSFDDFLAELDDGETARKLAEELQQVVRGVRRTSLVGSITLTLSVKPDGRTVQITPKVVTKIPTAKSNTTVFYDSEDGELTRNDPKQMKLKNVFANPKKETSAS